MSGQLWVPWVEDPHIKAKGLGKERKLAQEEWNVTETKVNAPGFCLGEEGTEDTAADCSLPRKETRCAGLA